MKDYGTNTNDDSWLDNINVEITDRPTPSIELEERYIVIKRSNFKSFEQEQKLRKYLNDEHLTLVDCLVVESKWTKLYNVVWELIKRHAIENNKF